ncbi:unnamed protein product [Haemonchus placei]|uniref:Chitin-binding type-2 domain-containing protein n=1 Tax=Haemonchus placei TaxID=6290 RepID=A0A0N4VSJ9_HAEPC|nr:unnamed protein product [Haemonchus placei]
METTANATDGTNVTSLPNATDDTNITSPGTAPLRARLPVKRSHLESEDQYDQDSDVSELEKQKDVPTLEIRAEQEIAYRYGGRATFIDEGLTTEATPDGLSSSDSDRIDTIAVLQEGRETIGKPCSVEHMSYVARNEEAGCTGAVEFSNEVCEAFFKCMSGGEMLLICRNMYV